MCICTYNRPAYLRDLLRKLGRQDACGLFSYSIVVADNDHSQSASPVVSDLAATSPVPIRYCVEPRQNIALARNKAIENASGDFIAFIDDDEFPAGNWLYSLFRAHLAYAADGVLGPVKPHFECDPPGWVAKGRFFDRPTHPTGHKMHWGDCRTGNVLFRRDILRAVDVPFRSVFNSMGEDVDFFRRMTERGCVFVWCDEAVVYEVVPASRCTRSYLLRRALLRGSSFPKRSGQPITHAAKSLIAIPCYALALPVIILFGEHLFLKYLIKLLDHASRLLAFLGWTLLTERQ